MAQCSEEDERENKIIIGNICIPCMSMSIVQLVHRPANEKKDATAQPPVSTIFIHMKWDTDANSQSTSNQHTTAHGSEGAHGGMARSRANVPDVEFGVLLELGSLAASVVVELPPLLVLDEVVVLGEVVELDEGVKVPLGMSDPGTAEIGDPAWDPAAGGQNVNW